MQRLRGKKGKSWRVVDCDMGKGCVGGFVQVKNSEQNLVV